jgi:hypothetical protein
MAAPDKRTPGFSPETQSRRVKAAIAKTRHKLVMEREAAKVLGSFQPRRGLIDAAVDEVVATADERAAVATARTPRETQRAAKALATRKQEIRAEAARPKLTREQWLTRARENIRSFSDEDLAFFDESPKFKALRPENRQAIRALLDEEGDRRPAESYGLEYDVDEEEDEVLPPPTRDPETGLPGPAPESWLGEDEEFKDTAEPAFGTDRPFGVYELEGEADAASYWQDFETEVARRAEEAGLEPPAAPDWELVTDDSTGDSVDDEESEEE